MGGLEGCGPPGTGAHPPSTRPIAHIARASPAGSLADVANELQRAPRVTPVLNRAEFRNSEFRNSDRILPPVLDIKAEFRPRDEAWCSAANTAQTGLFLSRVVVCIQTSTFSFAVVVTTPKRRVIPSNTLAYQQSVSYASFCENCIYCYRPHRERHCAVAVPMLLRDSRHKAACSFHRKTRAIQIVDKIYVIEI